MDPVSSDSVKLVLAVLAEMAIRLSPTLIDGAYDEEQDPAIMLMKINKRVVLFIVAIVVLLTYGLLLPTLF